jgi:hypothetical protein
MPTQHKGYFLKNGTRVPSVTTVLGRFKDAGPLMFWAWNCGKEGKDFREERDKAADSGTLAHAAVEAWVKREQFDAWVGPSDVIQRAQSAFGAFLEWAEQTRLKVDKTELPLVSEKYGFGGTFDAILIKSKRAMGDWKSSNGIYGEYLAQLAAYGILWEENFPDEPLDGGFHLCRFDKTHGDFTHKWWGELKAGWEYFIRLREAYEYDKELKARAK